MKFLTSFRSKLLNVQYFYVFLLLPTLLKVTKVFDCLHGSFCAIHKSQNSQSIKFTTCFFAIFLNFPSVFFFFLPVRSFIHSTLFGVNKIVFFLSTRDVGTTHTFLNGVIIIISTSIQDHCHQPTRFTSKAFYNFSIVYLTTYKYIESRKTPIVNATHEKLHFSLHAEWRRRMKEKNLIR